MTLLGAIVLFTLGTSFFCSLCEAAIYAVSDARVEQLAESGTVRGKRLRMLRGEIGQPIAAILTLNTISNTVGATFAGMVAATQFDSLGVGLFSAGFTLGILYISEIIPKTLGVHYANTLAPALSRPIQWIIRALWPLVWVCQIIARVFLGPAEGVATSEEDLLVLAKLGQRAGAIRPDEARWMRNALQLDSQSVADIMTPRTIVFSLPQETRVDQASQTEAGWPHSRVPITEGGDLDKVKGVVLRRDFYEALMQGNDDTTMADLMRKPIFVPEGMKVSDVLSQFLKVREHLFVVADEYGGVAGVVTLEDAIEALLGSEIIDEYDRHVDLQYIARKRGEAKLRLGDQQQGANDTRSPEK